MATKYKPLKDLQKESLRVRFTGTRDSLLHRAEGLEVSEEKLREFPSTELHAAADACQEALIALMRAHGLVSAYIAELERGG